MHVSQSITINAPPAAVFSWIEDPARAVAWMTNVARTEVLREVPGKVGTTFRETVADAGGRMTLKGVITAFRPGRRIAFHLESRVNVVDVNYDVVGVAGAVGSDGAEADQARVDVTATVRWKFPVNVINVLQGGKLERQVGQELAGELVRLKELSEQPDG